MNLIEGTQSTNVSPNNINTSDANLDGQERQLSAELTGDGSTDDESEESLLRTPEATATGCAATLQEDLANKHTSDEGSEVIDGGLQEDLPDAQPIIIRNLLTSKHSKVYLQPAKTTFDASTCLRPLRFADKATRNGKNKKSKSKKIQRRGECLPGMCS